MYLLRFAAIQESNSSLNAWLAVRLGLGRVGYKRQGREQENTRYRKAIRKHVVPLARRSYSAASGSLGPPEASSSFFWWKRVVEWRARESIDAAIALCQKKGRLRVRYDAKMENFFENGEILVVMTGEKTVYSGGRGSRTQGILI